jgi:hypothetical protein
LGLNNFPFCFLGELWVSLSSFCVVASPFYRCPFRLMSQEPLVEFVMTTRFPAVAAIHPMINSPGMLQKLFSRHAMRMPPPAALSTNKKSR